MIRSEYARRLLTVGGVIAVLVLGFASIRAASAWTAASAPLTVAPVTIGTLQSQLSDEHRRSAALLQELGALEAQSTDLAAALQAAHARIESDASHAMDLAAQLKVARQRLAKLETTIAAASRPSQASVTSSTIARVRVDDDPLGGGDD
jgi:chromosome segregation ATPase